MELRRVGALPPYVFAVTDQLKLELRRAGEDVIDLGFGNPDVPPPEARTPEALGKLVRSEIDKWVPLIASAELTAN